MTRLSRRLSIIILLMLSFGIMGQSLAQDCTYDLSKADYNLLNNATNASVNSKTQPLSTLDFTLNTDFEGVSKDGTLKLEAKGQWKIADGSTSNPRIQLTVDGTFKLNKETKPFKLEARYIDGYIYIQYTDESVTPAKTSEWVKYKLTTLIAKSIGIPEGLIENMFSPSAMANSGKATLVPPIDIGGVDLCKYVSMERKDDTEVNGTQSAHYQVDVDAVRLLSSPEFIKILLTGMSLSGGTLPGDLGGMGGLGGLGGTMDPNDPQAAQMFGMMIQMFVSKLNISVEPYVDLKANHFARTQINMELGLGGGMMSTSSSKTTIKVDLDLNWTGYGEKPVIEEPKDAVLGK